MSGSKRRFLVGLLVVLGFGLIGMALTSMGTPVAAQGDGNGPLTEGETCADCHLDVADHAMNSVHAQAFADPVFQAAWATQGNPSDCLACHTTGYSPRTETFEMPGVTCEACHGETPSTHPAEPITADPGVGVCEDCHTTTISEWERSGHAAANIACVECHAPHPQALRAETSEALCLGCHEGETYTAPEAIYIHDTHDELMCADCHWFHSAQDVDGIHVTSGNLLPSGHDNAVTTAACNDCHATLVEIDLEADPSLTLAQELEVNLLQSEIDSTKTQGENTAALRGAQGLVLGMLFGGVLMLLLNVSRNGATNTEDHKDEADE